VVADIEGGSYTEGVENRVLGRIFGSERGEVTWE
jgi:hypothetical protein